MNLGDLLGDVARPTHEALAGSDPTTTAILDAALRQFELFGIARTTIDDIATRARFSRVTVYRRFGTKDRLVEAVILRELHRFLSGLEALVEALATPEEKMVEGFLFTLQAMRTHRLLQRLLESEPEVLLPHLTIEGAPFIAAARDFLTAHLALQLEGDRTAEELSVASEIVVRLILSFLLTPQTPIGLDNPERARAFALLYIGPLLQGGEQVGAHDELFPATRQSSSTAR